MERWEPPVPPPGAEERLDVTAVAEPGTSARLGLATLGFLTRLAPVVVFGVPVVSPVPGLWSAAAGAVVVVALVGAARLAPRVGLSGWGALCASDAVGVGLVTPLVVLGSFIGSERWSLFPAEQAAFLQATFAALAALVAQGALAAWLCRREPTLAGVALLPSALVVLAVVALADLSDLAVSRATALAYLGAALATFLALMLSPSRRRWVPVLTFVVVLGATLLGVGAVVDPARSGVVTSLQWLLVALAGGSLALSPHLAGTLRGDGARGRGRRGRRRGAPRRRSAARRPPRPSDRTEPDIGTSWRESWRPPER